MAFTTLTAIALAGVAASAVGVGVSLYGQSQQTAAMSRAERARNQQMTLDAQRRRREIIRNAVVARSSSLFAASNQGAIDGSGLQGGYGQITGAAGRQNVANNQNESLGGQIFGANMDYYNASGFTNAGIGLQSLGGMVLQNAGTIDRVGTYAFGR